MYVCGVMCDGFVGVRSGICNGCVGVKGGCTEVAMARCQSNESYSTNYGSCILHVKIREE